jgi:Mlc titration factor MtfA (ptsG expression regulator)
MNGMPPLRRCMILKQWSEALSKAYDVLCKQVTTGESTFINPYAAKSPAEFFAVLSEYFFTAPNILKINCPDVYEQLVLFYQQPESRY